MGAYDCRLIRQIVASLRESFGVLEKAARASHAEATHESSKAESKYDTRGLEAAYLAGGQARQAKEILDSIKLYETLTTRDFAADEPIDLTALVELDAGGAAGTLPAPAPACRSWPRCAEQGGQPVGSVGGV
jgi:hypothetical protein